MISLSLLLLSFLAQVPPPGLTGPAAHYCVLQGRNKPVPCYVVDNIPGKPPQITVAVHGPLVERFTFAHTKHRLARAGKLAGKTVIVIGGSVIP